MTFWKKPKEELSISEYTDHQKEALAAVLERAQLHGEEGDWEGMAEQLHSALEDFPHDSAVLCWLGVAERELGLESQAYERFRACLDTGPQDPHILATAGNALSAYDDPAAEPALRTAAMLGPDLAQTRWLYGAYLTREGFLEQGLQELQAARKIEPESADITYELGVALALEGNHEGAIDEFHRSVELGTDEGWSRIVLGLALIEEDRLDEAIAELDQGARSRPHDVEAQLITSVAAAALSMIDLAWEMLERARQGAVGVDLSLADEVEDLLDREEDEARDVLVRELAPGAYRERLAQRP